MKIQFESKGMETTEQDKLNVKSRTEYRGSNQVKLSVVNLEMGFKSLEWGTYKQWLSLGRRVRKGQTGVSVYHPTFIPTGKFHEDGKPKFRSTRKYWRVFNEEQTEELLID